MVAFWRVNKASEVRDGSAVIDLKYCCHYSPWQWIKLKLAVSPEHTQMNKHLNWHCCVVLCGHNNNNYHKVGKTEMLLQTLYRLNRFHQLKHEVKYSPTARLFFHCTGQPGIICISLLPKRRTLIFFVRIYPGKKMKCSNFNYLSAGVSGAVSLFLPISLASEDFSQQWPSALLLAQPA